MLSAEVEENFEIFAWLLTNINLKRQMDTEWTCYIIRKALNLNGLGFLNGGGGGIRSCSLACNGNSAFYFKTLFFVKMLQPVLNLLHAHRVSLLHSCAFAQSVRNPDFTSFRPCANSLSSLAQPTRKMCSNPHSHKIKTS